MEEWRRRRSFIIADELQCRAEEVSDDHSMKKRYSFLCGNPHNSGAVSLPEYIRLPSTSHSPSLSGKNDGEERELKKAARLPPAPQTVSEVKLAADDEAALRSVKEGVATTEGKKWRSWLPDPEKRWPVQGW